MPAFVTEYPVHADVCKLPEEYKYSSALFYETEMIILRPPIYIGAGKLWRDFLLITGIELQIDGGRKKTPATA